MIKNKLKEIVKSKGLHIILGKLKFSFTKGKLRQILHFVSKGHLFRKYRINRFLFIKRDTLKKLQIGGGYHTKVGWLNGDIIAGDIYLKTTRRLPFPDSCIDFIFTEQFFEHLSYEGALHFLRESYRVLKPGGVIRQATPSLKGLIDVYRDRNEVVSQQVAIQRHIESHRSSASGFNACHFLNDMFRLWGHQFIYDEKTLEDAHRKAGFNDIQWKSFGESDHQQLQNCERHANTDWMRSAFVIICEATKLGDDMPRNN